MSYASAGTSPTVSDRSSSGTWPTGGKRGSAGIRFDGQRSRSAWPEMRKTLEKPGFLSGEDRNRTTRKFPGNGAFHYPARREIRRAQKTPLAARASRVGHDCSIRCGPTGKRNCNASSHCTWLARDLATRHGSLSKVTCWSPRMILPRRLGRRR